jgi:surface polysaccharide O-acyltransferase-like enzyme
MLSLADATPPDRDRYVDFLRAFSIGVVVIGHWLMAVVIWQDGAISTRNALEGSPAIQLLTWVLQVMPLFFFVGGFSNLVSYRSVQRAGGGYRDYLRRRMARLYRPVAVFLAVWAVLGIAVLLLGTGGSVLRAAAGPVVITPLWFLASYTLVVIAAPLMVRAHDRFGGNVIVALVLVIVAADSLRFHYGMTGWGYLNVATVWLFVHQIGFHYADGGLRHSPRQTASRMAAAGLVALVVLTTLGPYPRSTVGLPGDTFSNMNPPTLVIAALAVWLIGLALLARDTVVGRLQQRRAWAVVIAANSVVMTVYLWHLTALAAAVLVLFPAGFPQPEALSIGWWATRPLWLALLAAVLIPFIRLFARYERVRSAPPD